METKWEMPYAHRIIFSNLKYLLGIFMLKHWLFLSTHYIYGLKLVVNYLNCTLSERARAAHALIKNEIYAIDNVSRIFSFGICFFYFFFLFKIWNSTMMMMTTATSNNEPTFLFFRQFHHHLSSLRMHRLLTMFWT